MSVTVEDLKWRSHGGARDIFGRRYASTQVLMSPGYRDERKGFPGVHYMGEQEREAHEICFRNACAHWRNRPAAPAGDGLPPGRYLYVVSVEAKFYAIEDQPTSELDLHHSTIPAGKGLVCAGMLEIGHGHRLLRLDNLSGHYMPDLACLCRAVYLLRKAGCGITGFAVDFRLPAGYGNGQVLSYRTAEEFLVEAPYL